MSSTNTIIKTISASKTWETRGRDVPDLIESEDYRAFPEATADLVRERIVEGAPRKAERFPYPKPAPDGVREFVRTDPLDELAFRHVAGSVISDTDKLLSESVLTYRLQRRGHGWRCRYIGTAMDQRRDETTDFIVSDEFAGFGVEDVASFYASIHRPTLADLLADACQNPGDVGRLAGWLESLMSQARVRDSRLVLRHLVFLQTHTFCLSTPRSSDWAFGTSA